MRINLIPPDERPLKASAIRWEFVVGILGVCFVILAVGFGLSERAKVANLTIQLDQASDYQLMLQKQVQGVNALREEIRSLESGLTKINELVAPSITVQVLDRILSLMDDGIWAEAVRHEQSRIVIAGYADSMDSLTRYTNNLERAEISARITRLEPQQSGGFTTFTIEVPEVPTP